MNAKTIDHATLSELAGAGALRRARVVGQSGGWTLLVTLDSGERALAAQRGRQARVFKRMETLASYLKGVGISRFDVDSAGFVPEATASRARPDRAEALRNAHRASAHDAWFKAQVAIALDEADAPETEWIPADAANAAWTKKRRALAERSASGATD
jgi:hypothetical protein